MPRAVDRLQLDGRIQLDVGEVLRASDRVRSNAGAEGDVVLAGVAGPGGPQLRLGILPAGDATKWSAADRGGTARFDGADTERVAGELEALHATAKQARTDLRALGQALEDEGAFDAADLTPDQTTRLAEYEAYHNDDRPLAEGVIAGSGWGDIHWAVTGLDADGPGGDDVTVHAVVRPDGDRDLGWDEMKSGVTGVWHPAAYDLTGIARLARVAAKVADAATASDDDTTATARLLPIRFITTPSGADRGDRMGGRTDARAARTRMRVESKRKWFRIENKSSGTDIYLYGEIGCYGVTAADFCEELRQVKTSEITLHINSPGGDVFDGVAIHEALKNHPAKVNVTVDGVAASAASFIACVADPKRGETVKIARYAQMMIHEAAVGMYGDAKLLRKRAELLDKTSDIISNIYADRAGGEASVWRGLMEAETWFNAEEAVQFGLADEISGEPADADAGASKAMPAKAVWDLSVYAFAGRDEAPAPALVMALAAEPAADGETPGDVDPGEVDNTPAAEPAGPPAEPEPQPELEQPAGDPAPAVAPTTTTQPSAWAPPAWLDTPASAWRRAIAGITNPRTSTPDDATAQEAK